jgi:hypothetical protein
MSLIKDAQHDTLDLLFLSLINAFLVDDSGTEKHNFLKVWAFFEGFFTTIPSAHAHHAQIKNFFLS